MIDGLVRAAGEGHRFGGGVVVVLGADRDGVAATADLARAEAVVCEDWREGIAALLRAGVRGDAGARDLLADAGVREVECGHLCRPDDVDTREDLEAVRRRLEAVG